MRSNEIPATNWIKFWEAPVRPLYAFVSLRLEDLGSYINRGLSFNKIFIFYKDGLMSAYYYVPDVENFQRRAVIYIQNKSGHTNLEQRVDELVFSVEELKKKNLYCKEDFTALRVLFDKTHLYVGIIKTAGDASLDTATFEKLLTLRKRIETTFFDLNDILERIAIQISSKAGITKEDSMSLKYEEVIYFFEHGSFPSLEVLKSRSEQLALYITPQGFIELNETEYKRILDEINKDLSSKVLRGQIAYKGTVRGRCAVVRKFSADADIPEGSILVTGMTDPRFVPMMKKAAAIVTDAGGALCHAAIVARELKIPCIVGTRVATELLKTGYEVEVDAYEGVVTILAK